VTDAPGGSATRVQAWLGWLGCLVLVLGSMQVRIWRASSDPNFDSQHAEGMLKSDPALLYYFTERILDAGGGVPADFRRDPRVQHPAKTDIPGEFTVGQEFLVAWAYQLSGSELPLHVFAMQLMSLLAALAALGIYGVVWWRTRSVGWSLAATGLFCLMPANYRTIGFILVREDLALPLFLGHLALLARAQRSGRSRAYLLAGLVLGLALASWHAMGFFVVLELLVLHAWVLWPGAKASPMEQPGVWAVLLGPVLAAVLVPALAQAGFLLGAPMLLGLALFGVALLRGRVVARSGHALGRLRSLLAAGGMLLALSGLGWLLGGAGSSYAHVFDVLAAKLHYLGERPRDPNLMSFDARLLWQGPFETLAPRSLVALFGWSLGLLPLALWSALRCRGRGFLGFLMALTVISLPTAWLIGRTSILGGALLPMLVLALAGWKRQVLAQGLMGVLLVLQAFSFINFIDEMRLSWYQPAARQAELAELVQWVGQNVDPSEPIVGDFMNSTALLAHCGNPIVLQPKYETAHSRARAQAFMQTFFAGTPSELVQLVHGRFQAEWLLIDNYTLGQLSPWVAGYPEGPPAGSVGEQLLAGKQPEGYQLMYRSKLPSDYFRLYHLPNTN